MILWEYARKADGSAVVFEPPAIGQLWLVDGVTFAWDSFPIATHFTAAALLRSGIAIANYPYPDNVGDSTAGRSVAFPITSPIIVYPGQQLVASYAAGANANGFSAELRGTVQKFSVNDPNPPGG